MTTEVGFEYNPPKSEGVDSETTVLRPAYIDQYIIGKRARALDLLKGFELLDCFGLGQLRTISVLILPRYNMSELASKSMPPFTPALLQRFGFVEQIRGSIYSSLEYTDGVGVYCDVRNPVHITYDYGAYSEDSSAFPLLYASEIVHEWQHVQQYRTDLPKYSLWSERHAMTTEALFLEKLLQCGQVCQNGNERYVDFLLNWLAARCNDYRNGRGFEDHLLTEMEGTPLKAQCLHNEDYVR